MAQLERWERFKDARTVHNIHGNQTMDEVAAATGLSKNMISNLENEKVDRDVGYKSIAILANHYGVSSDYLLGMTEDHKSVPSVIDELALSQTSVDWIKAVQAGHIYGGHYDINWLFESKSFSALIDSIFSYICANAAIDIYRKARKQILPPSFSDLIADGYTFEAASAKVYSESPSNEEREELNKKLWEELDALAISYINQNNYHVGKHLHALKFLDWCWEPAMYDKGLHRIIRDEKEYMSIARHRVEHEVFCLLEELRGHITEE